MRYVRFRLDPPKWWVRTWPPSLGSADPNYVRAPKERAEHGLRRGLHLTWDSFGPVPYWIGYPLIGIIAALLGELLVTILHENDYPICQAILALSLGLVPGFLVFLRRRYDRWLVGSNGMALDPIQPPDGFKSRKKWLAMWRRHIFHMETRTAWGFAILVAALGMASYVWLRPQYRSPLFDALTVAGMTVLLLIWGKGGFTLWQLLRFLREVEKCDFEPPFFRIPHPATDALLRYYAALALGVDTGYGLLAVALICGPDPLHPAAIFWLSILASYPIVVTIWSILQIHALLRRAKQQHLEAANALVKGALKATGRTPLTMTKLEAVSKAMKTQATIQAVSDWPFSARTALSLTVAVISVLTQAAAFWIFQPFR